MIFTIGHSNRTTKDFIELLKKNGVEQLVDIRLIPKSRSNPQFGQARLKRSLAKAGIAYVHEPRMGGRRRAAKDSINAGWRNASFRGYADHMATREFKAALKSLIARARKKTTAIMCAEAVPWRCHRNLVADELVRRGHEVIHILGPGSTKEHALNPNARVEDEHLVYPK